MTTATSDQLVDQRPSLDEPTKYVLQQFTLLFGKRSPRRGRIAASRQGAPPLLLGLLLVALGGCFPEISGLIFDPFCFSHLGEDPRDFADFDTLSEQLRTEAMETNCGCEGGRESQLTVGRCGDGSVRYISRFYGFGGRTDYFNADGDFIGLTEWKDSFSLPCGNTRDWPWTIECPDRVTTEVICELFACEHP
mgnify:CR=1 FL=1